MIKAWGMMFYLCTLICLNAGFAFGVDSKVLSKARQDEYDASHKVMMLVSKFTIAQLACSNCVQTLNTFAMEMANISMRLAEESARSHSDNLSWEQHKDYEYKKTLENTRTWNQLYTKYKYAEGTESLCGKCGSDDNRITDPNKIMPDLEEFEAERRRIRLEKEKDRLEKQNAKDDVYEQQIDQAIKSLPPGLASKLIGLINNVDGKLDVLNFLTKLNKAAKSGKLNPEMVEAGLKALNVSLNASQRRGIVDAIQTSTKAGTLSKLEQELKRSNPAGYQDLVDLRNGIDVRHPDPIALDIFLGE